MPEARLILDDITAGYGLRPPAVLGVSLQVSAGEVVGLVGPNGSGKSSLLKVASRALRPRSGSVRLQGFDPYSIGAKDAAHLVAVVPQDVVPAFSFTSLEMVMMGRTPYMNGWGGGDPQGWERTRSAMAAVEVQHLADRPVDELSGGERQRVVLAQALAQDAPVLLLDEPTTHLDIRHVVELLSLVRGLAESEGKAVLAVMHDLTLAAALCDRMVVLHRGQVLADGRPEDVLTSSLLKTVYGVEAEIERSRATGKPALVLGLATAAPMPLGKRAHVIGGAGRGSVLMRRLAELGYEVTAGVLHGSDTDEEVASRMNLLRVSVPPFSGIDDAAARECAALLAAADVVFICDAPIGPANIRNLELAIQAGRGGTRLIAIEESPIDERDFTGGRASELWNELRTNATVVSSYEEALLGAG